MKRRTLLTLAPLALIATACSSTSDTSAADGTVNESLKLKENKQGAVDTPYTTPPTLEDKASIHVQGISEYIGSGVTGTFFLSANKDSIVGIDSFGQIVWQSAVIEDYKTAGITREGNRDWLLVHQGDSIKAYDLLSTGTDRPSVRETPAGEQVSINLFGVVHKRGDTWEKWSPTNGTKTTIKLPGGKGDILSATSTGYIYKDGDVVKAVSKNKSWGGDGNSTYLDSGTALAVIKKADGTILFLDTLKGSVAASAKPGKGFDDKAALVLSNTDSSFAFSTLLAYLDNKGEFQVEEMPSGVVGIMDGVAYLEDGSGVEISTKKELWENADAPSRIASGQALYLKDGELYVFDKKLYPTE